MTLFWLISGGLLAVALFAVVRPLVFSKGAKIGHHRTLALGLVVAVSAGSFLLYDNYGRPDLIANPPQAKMSHEQIAIMKQLEQLMPSNPNYAEGWMYLGQAYATLGRIDDAINAYRNVVRLQPDNPTAAAALGGLLIATSGGTVPPEAKALFQKVVDSGAQQPMAYYFLGVASVQDGNLQKAYDTWSVLAKMTPPGAPWIGMLSSQLSDISKELGKPVPPLPKE